ncbi:MAG TPA: NUDIX domain-containing protein [Pyrinomonadaceae bacterium]|nr:NUDIX domain-containing protein [Pyrinomonadaceae bacterium]
MSAFETKEQISAGGVVYRRRGGRVEVTLISVGEQRRWQLPKGLVGRGESPEEAALREVREETGLACEIEGALEKVEYWYFSKGGARRVRFHKFVHFYLMRYVSGDVSGHDEEVNEARWVGSEEAAGMLAFKGERKALEEAIEMIRAGAVG